MPPHVHKNIEIFQFYILVLSLQSSTFLILVYHSYQFWQFLIPFQSLYCTCIAEKKGLNKPETQMGEILQLEQCFRDKLNGIVVTVQTFCWAILKYFWWNFSESVFRKICKEKKYKLSGQYPHFSPVKDVIFSEENIQSY